MAHHFNEEAFSTGCSVHFVNARQKQMIPNFVRPLRRLGVPTAAIVDLDVFKKNFDTWGKLLEIAEIPTALIDGLKNQRSKIERIFVDAGIEMRAGIDGVEGEDREAIKFLIDQVREYGIFVVPGGELESWLKALDVTGPKGGQRVIAILQRLGETGGPKKEDLHDDVWRFVADIVEWIKNPGRKGMGRQQGEA